MDVISFILKTLQNIEDQDDDLALERLLNPSSAALERDRAQRETEETLRSTLRDDLEK